LKDAMTRTDRKIIFTALAFLAVVTRGKGAIDERAAQRIQELAELVESYCNEHVIDVSLPVSEETGALVIDQIIERHAQELREKEETRLPEDRQMLIKLLDRLQVRKSRRAQREFFSAAGEQRLADLVLQLLDEEIDDVSRAKLA
jgi:hypothetical protein